jgi:hypothetical protein
LKIEQLSHVNHVSWETHSIDIMEAGC